MNIWGFRRERDYAKIVKNKEGFNEETLRVNLTGLFGYWQIKIGTLTATSAGGGLRCGQAHRRVGPPGTEPKAQSQDRGGFWEKGHLEWVLRSWAPTVAAGLGGQATGEAWGPQRG